MRHWGTLWVAMMGLAGCAAEVSDAESVDVGLADEALAACSISRGSFTSSWTSRVEFSAAGNPSTGPRLDWSRSWLTNHLVTVDLSTGNGGRLLMWPDDTLPPPGNVSYMATDALWTAFALKPWDSTNYNSIRTTLINAGRYGNQIYDSIFRDVGNVLYRKLDPDLVHGQLLGTCTTTSGTTTQVRAFNYGSPIPAPDPRDSYVDTMVYAALDEYWNTATRQNGINRLLGIISKSSQFDTVFWDPNMRVFVDVASRADYDNGGTYGQATFKIGLVLYAIRVMGITSVSSSTLNAMRGRLGEAQHTSLIAPDNFGGLAHTVFVTSTGAFSSRTRPTGEATSIGIMAFTATTAQ